MHVLVVYQYVRVVHFYSHFSFSGRCWSYSLIVDIWRKEKKLRCIIVCLTAVILMLHVLSHMTRVSRCVKLILHIYVLREIHPLPLPCCTFQYPRVTFSRLCINIADQGINECSDVFHTLRGELLLFLMLFYSCI